MEPEAEPPVDVVASDFLALAAQLGA
jgi:hypothetical protein